MGQSFKALILKPHMVFLIIASVFGLLSVFLMPILEVPDENQHFQVAYGIFSSEKHDSGNLRIGKDLLLSESIVLNAIEKGTYHSYFTKKTSADSDGFAVNTNVRVFGGYAKASVFDITRLPQAVGVLFGRLIYPTVGFMVVMGRLFALGVFIAAIYFIIKKVRYGKWVFVMVACLPIIIQQAGSLSHDAVNMIAIFAWMAFIINTATQSQRLSKKQISVGALLAALLLLTKDSNIILLALLAVLPAKNITETKAYVRIRASKYWTLIKSASVFAFVLIFCAGLYVLGNHLLDGHKFYPHHLGAVLLNTFAWGDLGLIDATVNGMVGEFSNFYYHLPIWTVVTTFMVLAIVLLYEKMPKVTRRFALISGALFFGSILLISIGMYYAWAMLDRRLGPSAMTTDGIQGRYFTPLLILLLPPFAYLQKYIKVTVNSKLTIPYLVTSTSVLLLSLYVVQTWHFFWW